MLNDPSYPWILQMLQYIVVISIMICANMIQYACSECDAVVFCTPTISNMLMIVNNGSSYLIVVNSAW